MTLAQAGGIAVVVILVIWFILREIKKSKNEKWIWQKRY